MLREEIKILKSEHKKVEEVVESLKTENKETVGETDSSRQKH